MSFLLPGRLRLALLCVVLCLVPTLAACSRLGLGAQGSPPAATAAPSASAVPSTAAPPSPTPPNAASPTATTPPPTTAAPTPTQNAVNGLQDTVDKYVQDWQAGRYEDMYGLLSTSAQASITKDKFVGRYTNISTGIDEISVTAAATVPSSPTPTGTPPTVNVPMHVTYQLAVLGTIEEDNVLPLVQEGNTWKVAWTPGLIFKDLTSDRVVQYDPVTPLRGSILDRNGKVLAEDGLVVTVGVVPGEIKDEPALLKALSDYLKVPSDQIKQAYANAQPDWFVPIKDIPESQKADAQQKLNPVLGVAMREKHQRMYPYGEVAAHVVGYDSPVLQPEIKSLAPKGYDVGDLIGRSGLEAWGEDTLRGQKGATLAIADGTGQVVRVIARKDAVNGSSLVTTLDIDYQTQAMKTLGKKTGSIILMDPRDNSILAIASYPTFNPNLFITGMTDAQWKTLNGPSDPLLFRAASGLYPTGSIFKVITMAAGLEKGGFKITDTFNCGLDWNGLPGVTLHNWKAEGTLNL
ncbi:MAG TPA: NTF2-like N-terminal transpeptidase domain-containing protein, partial [Chloroflexota bacterium]|nr:NTF2-like N-terminal transpeptidase domain-containing protein [Chloroflexota bacterium]